jgi:hypothetical protein
MKTWVFDALRSRATWFFPAGHSASALTILGRGVEPHPPHGTTVASPPRYDELAVRHDATVQITSTNIQLRNSSNKT